MLIFEKSENERGAYAQYPKQHFTLDDIPKALLRVDPLSWPEMSELDVVRHYTRLSQKNFSIDTHFYPLGSCTMKYNPRGVHKAASHPQFLAHHPMSPPSISQGMLQCLYELQDYLKEITGMQGVSLTPMAGSQGEFAGVAIMKAYHRTRGDIKRTEILIPTAAHGTNPASAMMCGFSVKEIGTTLDGDLDLNLLKQVVSHKTAGIMLTNPSTLGVFERQIDEIARIVHEAGGLLYYDGANLNAILGEVKPGDMGFDIMHLNLHKTFATPHGAGGPGAGPVAVARHLIPYLPHPLVIKEANLFRFTTHHDLPQSIGRLSTFMGNVGILLRAYFYIRLLGKEGLHRVALFATLNANYLMKKLANAGLKVAYPKRRATHEFIISLLPQKKNYTVSAMDVAKRLLDYGHHAPTTYFPLLVPECLLIEPTETESKQTLDLFAKALIEICEEMKTNAETVKTAPHRLPVTRLDDVKAARELNIRWHKG